MIILLQYVCAVIDTTTAVVSVSGADQVADHMTHRPYINKHTHLHRIHSSPLNPYYLILTAIIISTTLSFTPQRFLITLVGN